MTEKAWKILVNDRQMTEKKKNKKKQNNLGSNSSRYTKVAVISQIMVFINRRFFKKKQGSDGVRYIA